MARIGLKNIMYSILDDKDAVTKAEKLRGAIEFKVELETADGELRGDDTILESDNVISGGKVSTTVAEDDDETIAKISGHAFKDGETKRTTLDQAPYLAINRVVTVIDKGVHKYKVEHLYKIKFNVSLPEETTKQDKIEYKTRSLEGKMFPLDNGDWSVSKTFPTYAEAEKYQKSLLTAGTASTTGKEK